MATANRAAIVDRLTFGGNIIETGTDSYRLAHTIKRNKQPAETHHRRTPATQRFVTANALRYTTSRQGWPTAGSRLN
jgi:hypothetical protein